MYLLDVNVLVALALHRHQFHNRVAYWLESRAGDACATCSITELGCVRVLTQVPAYGFTVPQARSLLLSLKESGPIPFSFLPDANDISHLPSWVKTPKQLTDGHLAELAKRNNAMLATLDEKISGSYLIPFFP